MQAQTNFLSAAWKWSNQGTIGRSFPSDLLMGWRVIWRLTESLSVVKQTTVRAHVFWLANNTHSMTTPPLAILTAALNLFDRFTEFFCSFFYFIIIFFYGVKVIELHRNGVSLSAGDRRGWRPLHYAARHGHKEVVRYIISNGKLIQWLIP